MKAKIIKNKKVIGNYYKITIHSSLVAKIAIPGQFIEIKVSDSVEPLLRRPFSIHRVVGSNIEILYEVIGKGSELLSRKKPGEYLDIIGPLGNGFNDQSPVASRPSTVIIAGGMGVAPLVFLAETLARYGDRRPQTEDRRPATLVLIGAKDKKHILCSDEFKKYGCKVKVATDDGSRGFKGKVTDLLKRLLSTMNYQLSTVYACGPAPMLQEISRISKEKKIPAQVSLEAHMACGIGACLGCVVDTEDGYKRVCKEGPVFEADRVIWEE